MSFFYFLKNVLNAKIYILSLFYLSIIIKIHFFPIEILYLIAESFFFFKI